MGQGHEVLNESCRSDYCITIPIVPAYDYDVSLVLGIQGHVNHERRMRLVDLTRTAAN